MKANKFLWTALLLLCTVLLLACDGTVTPPDVTDPAVEETTAPPSETAVPPVVTEPLVELTELALYEELFDIENKVELRLDISEETLLQLQEDYERFVDLYGYHKGKSPIYRKADLTVSFNDGEMVYHIEDVGIRMKGDISREDFYGPDGYINIVHFKLSFCETFDDPLYYGESAQVWKDDALRQARKNRTFASLEELDLKWFMNHDTTHVREYYCYEMLRENGVLAPRSNVISVDFNDTHMGLFQMAEPIDRIFIERNLPEEDHGGDLYKVRSNGSRHGDYTLGLLNTSYGYGIEDKYTNTRYVYNLKTNKKTSRHESLIRLISVINQPNVTEEEMASVVDMDYFPTYAAGTFVIGNPDEMRNIGKNHYVYFKKSDGKAIFIIYDCDRVFGILCGWNPSDNGMLYLDPYHKRMIGLQKAQTNPIYNKCISSDLETDFSAFCLQEYTDALLRFYDSDWWDYEKKFLPLYELVRSHYGDLTQPDVDFANMTESRQYFSLKDTMTDTTQLIHQDEYNLDPRVYFTLTKLYSKKYIQKAVDHFSGE